MLRTLFCSENALGSLSSWLLLCRQEGRPHVISCLREAEWIFSSEPRYDTSLCFLHSLILDKVSLQAAMWACLACQVNLTSFSWQISLKERRLAPEFVAANCSCRGQALYIKHQWWKCIFVQIWCDSLPAA